MGTSEKVPIFSYLNVKRASPLTPPHVSPSLAAWGRLVYSLSPQSVKALGVRFALGEAEDLCFPRREGRERGQKGLASPSGGSGRRPIGEQATSPPLEEGRYAESVRLPFASL